MEKTEEDQDKAVVNIGNEPRSKKPDAYVHRLIQVSVFL